jgi:hypothetical protein
VSAPGWAGRWSPRLRVSASPRPEWCRGWRAWPLDLLLVWSATGPAWWPLLSARLVGTHDGYYHLYRLFELDRALRAGDLYPRWAPEFALGYGYPVFNFYPPLLLCLAAPFALAGSDLIAALNLAQLVAALMAGAASYLLARDLFGRWPAIVAGVLYGSLPYLLIDLYVRGAVAETLGLALLPLVALALRRAALAPSRRSLALAGLVVGLLALAALAPETGTGRRTGRRAARALASLAAAAALGLGLSAIYWLPALLERETVQNELLTTLFYDFHNHFQPLRDVVQRTALFEYRYDYFAGFLFRAGLLQVLLAALAAAVGLARLPGQRRDLVFWSAVGAIGLLLQSSRSAFLWESLPLLGFVQFPWRMLALVGLATVLLVAGGVAALPARARAAAGLAAAALWLVAALALLRPALLDLRPDEVSVGALGRVELERRLVGTTTAGEYTPRWERRGTFAGWRDALAGGEGVQLEELLGADRNELRLRVSAPRGGTLLLDQYYFPGWSATVDGRPTVVRPIGERGLLGVDVAPGGQLVALAFERTPLRTAAASTSALAAAALLALLGRPRRRTPAGRWSDPAAPPTERPVSPAATVAPLTGLASLSAPSARSEPVGQGLVPCRRPPGEHRRFGFVAALERLALALMRWRSVLADALVPRPLSGCVAARAARGRERERAGLERSEGVRVRQDRRGASMPLPTAAGGWSAPVGGRRRFRLAAGLGGALAFGLALVAGQPSSAAPLSRPLGVDFAGGPRLLGLTDQGGGRLTLYWSATAAPARDYDVALRLIGADGRVFGRRDKAPRFGLRPTSSWRPGALARDLEEVELSAGQPGGEVTLVVGLHDGTGYLVPTGEVVRWREECPCAAPGAEGIGARVGTIRLGDAPGRSAPALPRPGGPIAGGRIQLLDHDLSALSSTGQARWPLTPIWERLAGRLPGRVRASLWPSSQADPPGAHLGGPGGSLATLAPGDALDVGLRWRALADVDEDYAVFTHLLDHRQQLIAQDDEWPRRGFSPTSLWRTGQETLDGYRLRVPADARPGRYTLAIGLYLRAGLRRLAWSGEPAGRDQIVLGAVKIAPQPPGRPLARPVDVGLGPAIRLLGFDGPPPERVPAGSTLWFAPRWRAAAGPERDYTAFVHLLDASGRLVANGDAPPLGGGYPTSLWEPGEEIEDAYQVVVPADLRGPARLLLGLYRPDSGERLPLDRGGDSVVVASFEVVP